MSTICTSAIGSEVPRHDTACRHVAKPLTHIPSLVSSLIDGADIARCCCCCRRCRKSNRKTWLSTQLDSTHAYFMKGCRSRHNNTATDKNDGLPTVRPSVRPSLRLYVSIVCLSVCLSSCLMLLMLRLCTLATWKMAQHCNYCRPIIIRLCDAGEVAAAAGWWEADEKDFCTGNQGNHSLNAECVFFNYWTNQSGYD